MAVIVSGPMNERLAQSVSRALGAPFIPVLYERYEDGEWHVQIKRALEGETAGVLFAASHPINDNLVALLLLLDALRRAGAKKIVLVLTYMGYGRQDKQFRSGEPLSAQVVARLIANAGADAVHLLDPHAEAVAEYFPIPAETLMPAELMAAVFKRVKEPVVVSPDLGGIERAERVAAHLGARTAVVLKKRLLSHAEHITTAGLRGNVRGQNAIIIDDIITTGRTLAAAVTVLRRHGASSVRAAVTHGVFVKGAAARVSKLGLVAPIFVTNSLVLPKLPPGFRVLEIAPFVARSLEKDLV